MSALPITTEQEHLRDIQTAINGIQALLQITDNPSMPYFQAKDRIAEAKQALSALMGSQTNIEEAIKRGSA